MARNTRKKQNRKITRNILNLAFLAVLLLMLLTGLLVTVVFPHAINEYENRYAEKIPRFTFASYADGSFQDGVEDAFADQIPFAEKMKAAFNDTFSRYTAFLLPKVLIGKGNTGPNSQTTPPVDDPDGGQTTPPGDDPNTGTTPGTNDPPDGPNTGDDPNGGETNPGGGTNPGGETNTGGETNPGGDTNNGQTANPGGETNSGQSTGSVQMPTIRSYPHEPLPDVPGQARIYTAKKTNGGRIILTNMDPADEIAYYVQLSDAVSLFRSHLVYSRYEYRYMKTALKSRADAINTWMAAHPEVTCYAYFVERETEIDLATNEKSPCADFVMEQLNLPEENEGIFRIENYDDLDLYYYKGDHHWNGYGSYEGYRQILKMILPDETPIVPVAVKSAGLANGSKATGSASVYCEEMSGYEFDWPALEFIVNGQPASEYGFIANYFRQTEREPESQKYTNYANCYGADNGSTVIRNAASNNGNILVIGESYDNAVLKLLACHFSEVHSIDLRNYKAHMGSSFHFGQYIKDNNITMVLWNGCLDFWTSAPFNPKD